MSQIAQQDHLVIDCGTSIYTPSDEAKTKLRKAYIRGTLHDVVLYSKNEQVYVSSKIIAYYATKTTDSYSLFVLVCDVIFKQVKAIDCGELQPEDYTDDVPYDGE